MEDELRSEYDLKTLKVRKMGTNRQSFGNQIIKLDEDVAEVFTSAESVNAALRLLIASGGGKQSLGFMGRSNEQHNP